MEEMDLPDYGNLYPLQVDQLVPLEAAKGQLLITSLIFLGIIVYAIYRYWKLNDSVLMWMLGAGIIAFFNEGNLEVLVHVTQPANGLYPMFWNYGMPMPLGLGVGYWGIFTLATYIAYRFVVTGLTKRGFWLLWVGIAASCLVMEIPGVASGVYTYRGDQMLRIGGYPVYNLWINATGWLFSGLLIMVFEPVLKGWKRIALSLLPCAAFAMSWGVIDIPIVNALNIQGMPDWGKWALWVFSFVLSILFTGTLVEIFATDSKNRWTIPWLNGDRRATV